MITRQSFLNKRKSEQKQKENQEEGLTAHMSMLGGHETVGRKQDLHSRGKKEPPIQEEYRYFRVSPFLSASL